MVAVWITWCTIGRTYSWTNPTEDEFEYIFLRVDLPCRPNQGDYFSLEDLVLYADCSLARNTEEPEPENDNWHKDLSRIPNFIGVDLLWRVDEIWFVKGENKIDLHCAISIEH